MDNKDLALVNKKKKTVTIVFVTVSILILLTISVITYLLVTNLPTNESLPLEDEQIITDVDISQYTDIELENISEMDISVTQRDEERDIVGGILSFRVKEFENDLREMRIVNLLSLTRTDIGNLYTPAKEDIENSNLQAQWLRIGKPPVLATSPSPPVFDIITEIKEINYPNTDHTFALLALSHGQEFAQANDSSPNYQIIIFAIKGDNIIRLESNRLNLITDLGLSLEESDECSELDHLFESILTYNVECLREVFDTNTYDEEIKVQAEELMEIFKIRE